MVVLVLLMMSSSSEPSLIALARIETVKRRKRYRCLELEVCILAWATTEAMLADVLDAADAHHLFEWLRRLSFIEHGPYGLFPHDLAREVLDADLRWRNSDSYAGADIRMGLKLGRIFQEAGLPEPRMSLGARVERGPDSLIYDQITQITRTLLPLMQRTGVARAEEVGIDTLL
jgi:hypothetical protein